MIDRTAQLVQWLLVAGEYFAGDLAAHCQLPGHDVCQYFRREVARHVIGFNETVFRTHDRSYPFHHLLPPLFWALFSPVCSLATLSTTTEGDEPNLFYAYVYNHACEVNHGAFKLDNLQWITDLHDQSLSANLFERFMCLLRETRNVEWYILLPYDVTLLAPEELMRQKLLWYAPTIGCGHFLTTELKK